MNTTLMSAMAATDAFLCVLVVIAACDYLRRVRPIDQPMLSVAFYLVAIGAFGSFLAAMQVHMISPFTVMIHAGIVLYAWARRGRLFVAR